MLKTLGRAFRDLKSNAKVHPEVEERPSLLLKMTFGDTFPRAELPSNVGEGSGFNI